MVLDHVLGEAASDGINPRFTGTISLRYVRATRLGNLHAEARIVRTEGVKTFAVGHLAGTQQHELMVTLSVATPGER